MELTDQRSLQRNNRIKSVVEALKEIEEDDSLVLDEQQFKFEIAQYFLCSLRVAGEYIKFAKEKLNNEKDTTQKTRTTT